MLAVMSATNPAKKEVQDLESAINALTGEVGDFIQKYIPDVADADVGDTEEYAEPEEPEEPKEKEAPEEPEEEKEEEPSKDQKKKIKDNEKEVTESAESAESLEEGSPVQDFKTLMYKTMYGKEYEMAIKVMQDENISAADAAKRFRHVDARALAELFKKY